MISPSIRKVLLRLCGILFGIVAALLFVEILLRISPPRWLVTEMSALNLARNVASFGSDVGWSVESIDGRFVRFVPNTQFQVNYYEYSHSVHIDPWGGRHVSNVEKKEGLVIPVLGDSFAFGLGVKDEETYASLLNARLFDQLINLGVPGSSLPNQVDQIAYRHKDLHLPPLYIFSFYTGNDYSDIVRYYNRTKISNNGDEDSSGSFIRWTDRSIFRNKRLGQSYLLQFLKRTVLRNYFYPQVDRNMLLPPACSFSAKRNRPMSSSLILMAGRKKCIQETQSYVRMAVNDLSDLMNRLHFRSFFIIIPDKAQVNSRLRASKAAAWGMNLSDLQQDIPSRIIEEELHSRNIPYFDLSGCLAENDALYYKSDDHFTPAGHKAAADCLFSILDKEIRNSVTHRH